LIQCYCVPHVPRWLPVLTMAYAMLIAFASATLEPQVDFARRIAMRFQTASIALDALQTMWWTVAVICNAMVIHLHWTVPIVETIQRR